MQQYRTVSLLAAGHLCADIMQGALPAVLPYLMLTRHLNMALAGGILFASSIASSLVQPLFGHYADRIAIPWLMPVGLLLAGAGMALVGVMPSYPAILLVVALCGLGVAAFHPEGARLANRFGGVNKATAMSLFSAGGNTGFALGPLLMIGAYRLCGLPGTLLLLIPALLIAALLLLNSGQFKHDALLAPSAQQGPLPTTTLRDAWGAFAALSLVVIGRSITFFALLVFIPPFWTRVLHCSRDAGNVALTLFMLCGIAGTLLGGRLADRLGYLRVIRVGYLLLFPLLFLFSNTRSVPLAIITVILLAVIYYAPYSAIVVLGQRYLPNRLGLSSGVTLGLSVSIGGAMAPLLGRWADLHGVVSTLMLLVLQGIVLAIIACTLPSVEKAQRPSAVTVPMASVE